MKSHVNLLPSSCQRAVLVRLRLRTWIMVCIAIVCLILVGSRSHSRQLEALEHRVASLRTDYAPVERTIERISGMREQLDSLDEREMAAKELEAQRYALTLLGAIGRGTEAGDGRLQVMRLELTDLQGEANPNDRKLRVHDLQPRSVRLTGISLDSLSVTSLVEGLRKEPLFREVELKSLVETKERGALLHQYTIVCRF